MSDKSKVPYYGVSSDGDRYSFKKKKQKVYLNIIDGVKYDGVSETDPLGMYTGVPQDPNDEPVQDADDL